MIDWILFVSSFVRLLIHYLFIYSSSVCLIMYFSNHLSIYLFIYSFIHLFVHLFVFITIIGWLVMLFKLVRLLVVWLTFLTFNVLLVA